MRDLLNKILSHTALSKDVKLLALLATYLFKFGTKTRDLQNKLFTQMALSKDGATKIFQILLGRVKRSHE